jgi:hypothetical protein
MTYRQFRYWSIERDCEVARLSMADDSGREVYAVIPYGGRGFRERRDDALHSMMRAIGMGIGPGEVVLT